MMKIKSGAHKDIPPCTARMTGEELQSADHGHDIYHQFVRQWRTDAYMDEKRK